MPTSCKRISVLVRLVRRRVRRMVEGVEEVVGSRYIASHRISGIGCSIVANTICFSHPLVVLAQHSSQNRYTTQQDGKKINFQQHKRKRKTATKKSNRSSLHSLFSLLTSLTNPITISSAFLDRFSTLLDFNLNLLRRIFGFSREGDCEDSLVLEQDGFDLVSLQSSRDGESSDERTRVR